jgi:hypothetical protein
MSLIGGCILAVILGIVGMVCGTVLKGVVQRNSDDWAVRLAALSTAILVALLTAGGAKYGKVNPGLWPNLSMGVLVWAFSHTVLLAWGIFVLGMDAGDLLKTLMISGVVAAILTAFFLLIHDTFFGVLTDPLMEKMSDLSRGILRWMRRRVWMR